MEELDYERDDFADIVSKDKRYDARAYVLLTDVTGFLASREGCDWHMSAQEIMDEFRETALEQFGPLTFYVLHEWGIDRTEDIGEMMSNLVETGRLGADEGDSFDDFANGFDFEEAFLNPYSI